jgi:hypothetical protein
MTLILNGDNVHNFIVLDLGSLKNYNLSSMFLQKCETKRANGQVLLKI